MSEKERPVVSDNTQQRLGPSTAEIVSQNPLLSSSLRPETPAGEVGEKSKDDDSPRSEPTVGGRDEDAQDVSLEAVPETPAVVEN